MSLPVEPHGIFKVQPKHQFVGALSSETACGIVVNCILYLPQNVVHGSSKIRTGRLHCIVVFALDVAFAVRNSMAVSEKG
jgi:hypothetical protein